MRLSQVIALLRYLRTQKDPQLPTLYHLAHTFLQDFCMNNPQNQELLHADVEFLMVRHRAGLGGIRLPGSDGFSRAPG